jgi:ApbE superfamily uncharacterized protein (UPF0280 family)
MTAHRVELSPGRWHFQHGPMDIVLEADGQSGAVAAAHEQAWRRFTQLLDELVVELPTLKRPIAGPCPLSGRVARRMWQACRPYRDIYITPMAAVAGSVAQELLAAYQRDGVERAWVNNGGDIALHLDSNRSVRVGMFSDLARLNLRQLRDGVAIDGRFEVCHSMPVRGIATSGWRGRSFSLGIADSVTVLAATAAQADAAATVIANAVDVDDPRIERRPASELKDDSDLGDIPVTVNVGVLDTETVQRALEAGLAQAQKLQSRGLIWSSALVCQGRVVSTGGDVAAELARPVPALAL